jgi:Tat protein secretion system quality control protein TatD with DNase activity
VLQQKRKKIDQVSENQIDLKKYCLETDSLTVAPVPLPRKTETKQLYRLVAEKLINLSNNLQRNYEIT